MDKGYCKLMELSYYDPFYYNEAVYRVLDSTSQMILCMWSDGEDDWLTKRNKVHIPYDTVVKKVNRIFREHVWIDSDGNVWDYPKDEGGVHCELIGMLYWKLWGYPKKFRQSIRRFSTMWKTGRIVRVLSVAN